MKRTLALVLALVLILATGASAFAETVRIAWLSWSDRDTLDPISGIVNKGTQAFVELLKQKFPGTDFEIISVPGDGWIQKMETTLMSGEADIGWYTNQVLAANWFIDHREFMAKDPSFTEATFEATFTPGAKQYTRYHTYDFPESAGAIYGLPYDVGAYWIMYDKVLLEQWGVTWPEGPVSYQQICEMAQKMTGTNPVTGKTNFGAYIKPFWCEWLGVGADLYHPISDPTMDITKLDIAKDVDYIKDSPEVLAYFQTLEALVKCAPAGAAAGTGAEKWLTEDNDIAIMMDTNSSNIYLKHVLANNAAVVDRFIPVMLPVGSQQVAGFPEVHHVAVAKQAKNPDLAWQVVKTIATDKDMLNLVFDNYAYASVPALADPSGINIMNIPFTAQRYQDRLEHTLITDDYWYWREPINKVFSSLFSGELTPETAREAFYNNVVEWVANKKLQLGK